VMRGRREVEHDVRIDMIVDGEAANP
jgi:hypothetical protein